MEEEISQKKPRGNPNFVKRKQEKTMADEKEEVKKEEKVSESTGGQPNADTTPAPDTLPSDLFSDKIPDAEILPLDGQVKEKPYASLPGDIPADTTTSTAPTSGEATPSTPAAVVDPVKTPEEQKSAAEQTVMMMLRGYEKLHQLGRWVGKIDQSDLQQLHAKGKIDLEKQLPLGRKSISVGDFFNEYNAGVDQNITVSEEFKKD